LFIGQIGCRVADVILEKWRFESVDDFTKVLKTSYTEEKQRIFMVSFFCNIVATFRTADLKKNWVAVVILNSLVSDDIQVPHILFDQLIQFANLVSVTADAEGQFAGTALMTGMLATADHPIERGA
jgi:hypothetical protein